MINSKIYEDLAKRTGKNFYIGVVGPVRSGKSTFIAKFMEEAILPNVSDFYEKQRAIDTVPQSANGRAVMTTEPKFVPSEPVQIEVSGCTMNVKMADCVGYMIPGADDGSKEEEERMVNTPWSESPISFSEAAKIGTEKVINDHATIAMLVTTDGSVCGIERENYEKAEEEIAGKLTESGKPFTIILNSSDPSNEESIKLAYELEKKYGAPVALINCNAMNEDDIKNILSLTIEEFPVCEMRFSYPEWVKELDVHHPLRREITETVKSIGDRVFKMGDIKRVIDNTVLCESITECEIKEINAGEGKAKLKISLDPILYYKTLSEIAGESIKSEGELLKALSSLSNVKSKYDKVKYALSEGERTGYGIVMPSPDELTLSAPRCIKRSGSYGVKIEAGAESIHMIRANILTEINPIVGTEEQSKEIVSYLASQISENPKKVWDSNMFGKSLFELVSEALDAKLSNVPDESRKKLSETLERIINEGSAGLICILV